MKKTYLFSVVVQKQVAEQNSLQVIEELLDLLAEIISNDQFQMISKDEEHSDG